MNYTQKQHYIPQFILRNFKDSGHILHTCKMSTKEYKAVRDVSRGGLNCFYLPHFYEHPSFAPNNVEHRLCNLETIASKILKAIVSAPEILTQEHLKIIIHFMLIQRSRTPKSRASVQIVEPLSETQRQSLFLREMYNPALRKLFSINHDVLIYNTTPNTPYLGSNHPAITIKLSGDCIGDPLTESTFLFMPISPTMAIGIYPKHDDSDLNHPFGSNMKGTANKNFIRIARGQLSKLDVDILNTHQLENEFVFANSKEAIPHCI